MGFLAGEAIQNIPIAMASKMVTVLVDSEEKVQIAVDDLRKFEMLSVDCEGVNLGKDGELCLLQIATKDKVYLFDIVELKGKAFERGKQEYIYSKTLPQQTFCHLENRGGRSKCPGKNVVEIQLCLKHWLEKLVFTE